jgi:superfamily I DNA/RNA helicase
MDESKYFWSVEQQDIFGYCATVDGSYPSHAVVLARAGAAKTTSMVHGSQHIPFPLSVQFFSFSSRAVSDLNHKLRAISSKHSASTFNAYGMSILRQTNKRFVVDKDKYKNLCREYIKTHPIKQVNQAQLFNHCFQIVNLLRLKMAFLRDELNSAWTIDRTKFKAIAKTFNIPFDEYIFNCAQDVLRAGEQLQTLAVSLTTTISFGCHTYGNLIHRKNMMLLLLMKRKTTTIFSNIWLR